MTVCNMSIEGGARAGLIAPDEKTFAYVKGRPRAPKGEAWDMALDYWKTLYTDDGAHFDKVVVPRRRRAAADRHLGHQPEDVDLGHRRRAQPRRHRRPEQARAASGGRSTTWASSPARTITDITIERVFIGSCTNGRIEDLRAAAEGRSRATRSTTGVNAMVVPGSGLVKEQAEAEGLDKIFIDAGFEWREPGCSMCLAMNPDKLKPQRALRLDLEPQLRGPPGLQGPHAPRLAGRWPRPPRSPATSSTSASGRLN